MPKSKGHASRDESGTWRKAPAEVDEPEESESIYEGTGEFISDEKSEFEGIDEMGSSRARSFAKSYSGAGQTEFDGIGEGIVKKPRTVSVAKPARVLRPKTKLSAAGTESPTAALIWMVLTIGGAVIACSCLFGLVVYLASRTVIGDENSQPRRITDDELSPGLSEAVEWVKKNGSWGEHSGEMETSVETVDATVSVEKVLVPKSSGCVCPQCPAHVETTACTDDQGDAVTRSKDLFPTLLEPYMARISAVPYTRQFLDFCAENMVKHPWVLLLVLWCAASKILEMTLPCVNMALTYVLKQLQRLSQMMEPTAFSRAGVVDENSQRARKDAEQALLTRRSTTALAPEKNVSE